MRRERIRETRAWVAKARSDLRAAELLLAGEPSLVEPALFHCQQVAEKVLKAYLVWGDRPFPKTHDLVALLTLCVDVEPDFAALEDAAIVLTPYAVTFRYPGEMLPPTLKHSEEALRFAREVFSFVLDRLPPEARA